MTVAGFLLIFIFTATVASILLRDGGATRKGGGRKP